MADVSLLSAWFVEFVGLNLAPPPKKSSTLTLLVASAAMEGEKMGPVFSSAYAPATSPKSFLETVATAHLIPGLGAPRSLISTGREPQLPISGFRKRSVCFFLPRRRKPVGNESFLISEYETPEVPGIFESDEDFLTVTTR
ncbi:hypothetical protein EYF80_040730 [Liparis tanakae]|uniref:Uncharacterized protein n=1 Tax=Liparis tanakae TaxID=230148 RepID=A0A4Z2G811_9TELE|nr:hypothetical protein EYF80_040730 [Liparis tanakae]